MNIQEVLFEMHEYLIPDSDPRRWADALEAAMREPVAEYTALPDGLEWRFRPQIFDPPVGTKLYCLPPDAAGEIERLKSSLQLFVDRLKAQEAITDKFAAEVERLKVLLSHWHQCWLDDCDPDSEVLIDTLVALAKESAP